MADWSEKLDASIKAFRNRPRYLVLSEDIIATIPDANLELAIIDHVLGVKVGRNTDRAYEIISGLSPGFRMGYGTWLVEAEVSNGGFNQYFWNWSGRFAGHAVDGFRLLGASALAALMERAIAVFSREEPLQRKLKEQRTLEAFSESYKHTDLGELDKEFYPLAESLSKARIAYIRSHPREFVSAPSGAKTV